MNILSVLTAVATLITAGILLYKAKDERKKIEAEREQIEAGASETITRTALLLIEPLQTELTATKKQVDELIKQRLDLEKIVAELRTQVALQATEIDSANTRIARMQIELDRARAQISKYQRIIRDNGLDIDDAAKDKL